MAKNQNPPASGPNGGGPNQPDGSVALEVRSLSKSFGAVHAAREVSFEIRRGEVLGLLGDNGAGKTTVVNCVSGGLTPDAGEILIDGSVVSIENPEAAHRLGVETVHQDLSLVDTLDVATNLFLNREHTFRWGLFGWLGWLDRRRMYRESREILDRLSIDIPSVRPSTSCQEASGRRWRSAGPWHGGTTSWFSTNLRPRSESSRPAWCWT